MERLAMRARRTGRHAAKTPMIWVRAEEASAEGVGGDGGGASS